jgi:hypothetical protein
LCPNSNTRLLSGFSGNESPATPFAESGRGYCSMSDRGDYEELAAQCIRQAQETAAPEMRAFLLMMAQAWMKLADRHEQLKSLAAKTSEQTGIDDEQTG